MKSRTLGDNYRIKTTARARMLRRGSAYLLATRRRPATADRERTPS
jgi:hypothetical protein